MIATDSEDFLKMPAFDAWLEVAGLAGHAGPTADPTARPSRSGVRAGPYDACDSSFVARLPAIEPLAGAAVWLMQGPLLDRGGE